MIMKGISISFIWILINILQKFEFYVASDEVMFWLMIYLIIDSVIITPAVLYYAFVKREKKDKKEKRII